MALTSVVELSATDASALATAGKAAATAAALPTPNTWTDGATFGDWRVVFAGYGKVTSYPQDKKRVTIAPQVVNSPSQTSSALVVSRKLFSENVVNYNATLTTKQQLRASSPPNAWEVGWVVWDYRDDEHFYYAVAKPNGWELGKRDPAYPGGQRFLATGISPEVAVGQQSTIEIIRSAPTSRKSDLTLRIDGVVVSRFADTERPYRTGSVGIYSEDAAVDFEDMTVNGAALLTQ